jgi:hypothetical protein
MVLDKKFTSSPFVIGRLVFNYGVIFYLLFSQLSSMLSAYKSSTRTMHREEGVRMYRHLLDMLTDLERLRTGGSDLSSRSFLHTDSLIQVWWIHKHSVVFRVAWWFDDRAYDWSWPELPTTFIYILGHSKRKWICLQELGNFLLILTKSFLFISGFLFKKRLDLYPALLLLFECWKHTPNFIYRYIFADGDLIPVA